MVKEADGGCLFREVEDERKEPEIFGARYGECRIRMLVRVEECDSAGASSRSGKCLVSGARPKLDDGRRCDVVEHTRDFRFVRFVPVERGVRVHLDCFDFLAESSRESDGVGTRAAKARTESAERGRGPRECEG